MADADARLALAVLLSAALHASLIFGVAVRRPSMAPASEPILARIEAVPDAAARPPEPPREEPPRRAARPAARTPAVAESPADASSRANLVRRAQQATPETLPPVEMPLLVDPTWYPAAQLDVFPTALAPVRPAYPQAAADADVGGKVTLLLLIDEAGHVHDSAVVDAQPANTFEEAALEAFRAARFRPGERDGRSVRSRVLVRVVFHPAEAGAAVSR
ncbi:MAG TPA: energy transducer TonB [Burkholderiales bacterium]|nr:energy transducer TonB [Burkholderiales bacterium]